MTIKNITCALVLLSLTLVAEEAAGSIPSFGPIQELSTQIDGKGETNGNHPSQARARENAPDSLQAFRRSSNLRANSGRSGRTPGTTNTRKSSSRSDKRINDYSNRPSRVYKSQNRTRHSVRSGNSFESDSSRKVNAYNPRHSRSFEFITPTKKPSAD